MKKDRFMVYALCVAAVAVGLLFFYLAREENTRRRTDPNCVEQPSVSLPLKSATVHGLTKHLSICGIRSRSALPDVIQCYEMREGCTE